jgi:hypothetical protein
MRRVLEGPGSEERLRRLKRRFRAISARHERAIKLRSVYRVSMIAVLAAIGAFTLCWGLLSLSPWPPMITLRHIASFPNCDAARAVGLAPAYKGQPGYWQRHDRDSDGQSCEPGRLAERQPGRAPLGSR